MGTHFLGVYGQDKIGQDISKINEVFYPGSMIGCFQTICIYDINGQKSVAYYFNVPFSVTISIRYSTSSSVYEQDRILVVPDNSDGVHDFSGAKTEKCFMIMCVSG